MKNEIKKILKNDSWLFVFLRSILLTIVITGIFGVIVYIVTPGYQQDVAKGDFAHIDNIIANKAEIDTISNTELRMTLDVCRKNLKNTDNEIIKQSINSLHQRCQVRCSNASGQTHYRSPLTGMPLAGGDSPVCTKGCSDEVKQSSDHLQKLIKGRWLEADNFSKYMELYQNPGYTIKQKIFFFFLLSFFSVFLFFSIKKTIKNIKIKHENLIIKKAEAIFTQAKSKDDYRRVPVPEEVSSQGVRLAMDHELISEDDSEYVKKAVLIIEHRNKM